MIQPAFMFIVGVAVPYAYAKRAAFGQSRARLFGHWSINANAGWAFDR